MIATNVNITTLHLSKYTVWSQVCKPTKVTEETTKQYECCAWQLYMVTRIEYHNYHICYLICFYSYIYFMKFKNNFLTAAAMLKGNAYFSCRYCWTKATGRVTKEFDEGTSYTFNLHLFLANPIHSKFFVEQIVKIKINNFVELTQYFANFSLFPYKFFVRSIKTKTLRNPFIINDVNVL